MKRFITLVIVVSLLMLTRPLVSFAGCEPNAPPDCSCGKLPVCVFSGHPDGMYSDLYAKSKDPLAWKDFGQDIGDYAMAMEIEDKGVGVATSVESTTIALCAVRVGTLMS